MDFFYLLVMLAVLLILSAGLAVVRYWRVRTRLPYQFDGLFLSPAERGLLLALDASLGSRYRVFAKILAEDVIRIERRVARAIQERAYGRLADLRFDYLVCDAQSLRVLCAVDLIGDDGRRFRKPKADAILARVCRAASLPLVSVVAAERYEPADLAEAVLTAIGPRRSLHAEPLSAASAEPEEEDLLAELAAAIRHKNEPLVTTPSETLKTR